MPKQQRSEDAARLRDWVISVVRYVRARDSYYDPDGWIEKNADLAFRNGDIRGLRLCARDLLSDVLTECDSKSVERLDAELKAQVGVGLGWVAQDAYKDVERVTKRKRIVNLREYYAVRDRLDNVNAGVASGDAAELSALLLGFEQRYRPPEK